MLLLAFLLPLSLHHGRTTYTVDALPVLGAAAVCALGIAVLWAALVRLLRAQGRLARHGLPPLVVLLCAAAVSLWVAEGPHASLSPALFFPLAIEHASALLAVTVAFAALAVVAREGRGGTLVALSVLLLAGAYPAHRHAAALEDRSQLPAATLVGPPVLHLGKSRDVVPQVYPRAGFQVAASAARVTGTRPGPLPVTVRATSDALSLETEVILQVAEPRASPLFPLRDGAVLRFLGSQTCTYDSGKTATFPATASFTVTAAPARDGLALFQVDYAGRKRFTAYAADGQTYWLHEDGRGSEPVVSWDRRQGSDCTVAPVDVKARCTQAPEGISELFVDSGVGTAHKVVLGLLTLGIGVPEGSTCQSRLLRHE